MTPALTTPAAKKILAELKAHEKERFRLMDTLRMWAQVEEQGIGSDEVRSFTFDEQVFKPKDALPVTGSKLCVLHRERARFSRKLPNGHWRPLWYNVVILKTGERRKLDPMIQAPPEEDVATRTDDTGRCPDSIPAGTDNSAGREERGA